MDLEVDDVIDGLLSKTATEMPSDPVKPDDLEMRIPEWYDEEKFNRGRKFYWENCYMFSTSMLLGLVAVLSVPSILRILISTRRSNSVYTAYQRYLSTLLNTVSWFEHDFKPGSASWKSLMLVRSKHFRAGVAAQLKGHGTVSQRDLALTQFGFISFSLLRPDSFGIRQRHNDDWEAYNHFWAVIGYAVGVEDRYNICRRTVDESREVSQILMDRVFTPCLTNVPEYFEHMARSMLDGLWSINPTINIEAMLYWTKYLASVPGYIFKEEERVALQKRLKQALKGKSHDVGVDTLTLIQKCAIDGLPANTSQFLFVQDFNTLETVPAYKKLDKAGKGRVGFYMTIPTLYGSWLGRMYFNINFRFSLLLMKYLPYLSFLRYGVKASYVNIFSEHPTDDAEPITNAEFYKTKPPKSWSLYDLFSFSSD